MKDVVIDRFALLLLCEVCFFFFQRRKANGVVGCDWGFDGWSFRFCFKEIFVGMSGGGGGVWAPPPPPRS